MARDSCIREFFNFNKFSKGSLYKFVCLTNPSGFWSPGFHAKVYLNISSICRFEMLKNAKMLALS